MGRISTNNEPRSGHPVEVTPPEITEKNHKIILADRRVKVREVAESIRITTERIRNILHEHLTMKKLCARWVPRLLAPNQKQRRKDVSADCLAHYRCNPTEFCVHPLLSMKHGSIFTPPRQNSSRDSGPKKENLRRKRRQLHRPVRLWPPSFGMRGE